MRISYWSSDVCSSDLPLPEIDRDMARAAIAAEDSRFCSHWGFDLEAIGKAVERHRQGRKLRGGSPISQQTAKNAFLWQGRSWVRKGLGAWFTVLIEQHLSKHRIMGVYLRSEVHPSELQSIMLSYSTVYC